MHYKNRLHVLQVHVQCASIINESFDHYYHPTLARECSPLAGEDGS